ncbi:MAG: response regulator [Candidatus Krumholzibacteriia bacterium]
MPRILVIDEDEELRTRYRHEFEVAGHEVVTVGGARALQAMRESNPALVVMETELETANGLDLMREMLTSRPSLPVILNTRDWGYRDDFSSWLAEACLLKSSDTTELGRKVHEVLERCGTGLPETRQATAERIAPRPDVSGTDRRSRDPRLAVRP